MPIDIENFWDDNYYNHPNLTDEMVRFTENSLKVKLPSRLIELLKKQNGGYTKGFAFPMNQKTTWADNHIPLSELFGIVTDKAIETSQNILDTNYMTEEWGLPQKQVLLTGDGHWWITLDYRGGNNPTVRWIDVECNEDIHVADSFDDFIDGLVSEDEYADHG
jgi:hypothetical protein